MLTESSDRVSYIHTKQRPTRQLVLVNPSRAQKETIPASLIGIGVVVGSRSDDL
jgi:hypothetical protein